ncbi:hypothetical protein [Anaerotruncus rubiinfantis]|uniref:hypothetical protein n=1 Tax=Anaerotruncus rubiinfantis TaxID=1720200 RepID=UPI00082EC101|nr:hypothetical protein [Anaerotruncus rubiinfantis]
MSLRQLYCSVGDDNKKEVFTIVSDYFLAEIDRQKRLQKLTYRDIAKKAGINYGTMRKFMCGTYNGDNERIADLIAAVLKIER